MIDYSKLSDFEINKRIAEVIYKDRDGLFVARSLPSREEVTVVAEVNSEDICIAVADYCNNWSDAGPIIYNNGISIGIYGYGEWGAGTINYTHIDGVNPLRAAMIVFLMMQENK